jgi:hypothetical protein
MTFKAPIVDSDKVAAHAQEIEFALLLSHMINIAKDDPQQLRLAVYDVARAKLKEQIEWADVDEQTRLTKAMETAIAGVERFSQRPSLPPLGAVQKYGQELAAPPLEPIRWNELRADHIAVNQGSIGSKASLVGIGLFVLAFAVTTLSASLYFQQKGRMTPAITNSPVVASVTPPTPAPPPQPGFPLPAVYGVYALENDKLSELSVLPAQVPDRRVAISSPIAVESHTALSNGNTKFIVFRRDLATSAPERVEVRVVAQVMRSISFDPKGNRSIQTAPGDWSVRNISYPFRVRPIPGYPEMVLVQPEKENESLPAGRYVLAFQERGYDFTIAGPVRDAGHCLEKTEAANGVFYSECQKVVTP